MRLLPYLKPLGALLLIGSLSVAAADTPVPAPAGAQPCAKDQGICVLPTGTHSVWFGAKDRGFIKSGLSGRVPCNSGFFGDPFRGEAKSCMLIVADAAAAPAPTSAPTVAGTVPPPAGSEHCAREREVCVLPPGTHAVWFGANGKGFLKPGLSGKVNCSDSVFGDPDRGVAKVCLLAGIPPEPAPANAVACAKDQEICALPEGVHSVWYGAKDRGFLKTGMTGKIRCNDGVFGDPYPGEAKMCMMTPTPGVAARPIPVNAGAPGVGTPSSPPGSSPSTSSPAPSSPAPGAPVSTPTAAAPATVPPPAGGAVCAKEHEACVLPAGSHSVWFGSKGKGFVKAGVSGRVTCDDTNFGDPDRGLAKVCMILGVTPQPMPAGAVQCGRDHEVCILPQGSHTVWYGTNGKGFTRTGLNVRVACDDGFFGDPARGQTKACWAAP